MTVGEYTDIGLAYVENGEYTKAIKVFEQIIGQEPEFALPYLGLGFAHNILKQYEESARFYEKAITLGVSNAFIHSSLGEVHSKLKQYEQAIDAFQQAIALNKNDVAPYHGLGNVYYILKKYEQAIDFYKQAIALDQNDAVPYHGLGNVYSDLKQYNQAINAYKQAINLDQNLAASHYSLANAYYGFKQYEQAVDAFQQAIALDQNDAAPYNGLGNAHFSLKQYDQAIDAYKRAIGLDQNYSSPYNGLGNAFCILKQYDQAITNLQKAITLDQNCSTSYNGLGNAYYYLKQYGQAIDAFQQAIALHQNEAAPYNGLGNVYSDLKQYDQAIDAYKRATDLDQNFAMPHYGLGHIYHSLKQYDQAIDAHKRAIALDQNDAAPYNGLGNVYDDLKQYDQAIDAYKQAIILDQNLAVPHNGLANVYREIGDYTLAQKHYIRSLFEETNQEIILETLPHIIPFFRDHTDAPYILKAIFDRFPYLEHLPSYKKAILQYTRQCKTVDAYVDYLAFQAKKSGEDYWSALALINYYMGHVAEAYRIYDAVLDQEYDLNLTGQFYYLCTWADYLEPGLETALFDAIKHKVKPFVCGFNRESDSVTELYYAGQIYFWAWETFRRKVFLRAADAVFRQADYFTPAQYMRVLTLQALGDIKAAERQIEKVRKERQQIYQNGFKKQKLSLTQPALGQLKQYAHFREIQSSLVLVHPEGMTYSVPAFYEAWEVELDSAQKKESQDYKKNEAGEHVRERIRQATEAQKEAFSESTNQQRADKLANTKNIGEAFEKFLKYAQEDDSKTFERKLARYINAWDLTIPPNAELKKQVVYADFVKYFYSVGKYDLPTMLLLLNYVYHLYVEHAEKEGNFIADEAKTYTVRAVLTGAASFVLGPGIGSFVGVFTRKLTDSMEKWLTFRTEQPKTGIEHYEHFKEYYLENLGDYLPELAHDELFEETFIDDLVDWHGRQFRA